MRGELAAIRASLGEPPDFPNCDGPSGFGRLLEYALHHSPLAAVAALLEQGADPNHDDPAGFPSLIAALGRERKDERLALIGLLVGHGANIHQRGINDWTPLHYAAVQNDTDAIALLLELGADPGLRSRIDDGASPLEEAERMDNRAAADLLRQRAGK